MPLGRRARAKSPLCADKAGAAERGVLKDESFGLSTGKAHEAHDNAWPWRLSGGKPRDRRGRRANDGRRAGLLRPGPGSRLLPEIDGRNSGEFRQLLRLLHRLQRERIGDLLSDRRHVSRIEHGIFGRRHCQDLSRRGEESKLDGHPTRPQIHALAGGDRQRRPQLADHQVDLRRSFEQHVDSADNFRGSQRQDGRGFQPLSSLQAISEERRGE